MSNQEEQHSAQDKLTRAYDRMMERVRTTVGEVEKSAIPTLQHSIEAAKEKAVELGELTREEAERIAMYLRRDLHDAAEYLANTGRDLRDWLRFDLDLIEDRLRDLFSQAVDQTRVELAQLQHQTPLTREYHPGEITGIGTLLCVNCGKPIHFHTTSRIPPCPRCHGSVFVRASAGTD